MLSLLTGAGLSRVQDWSKDLKTQTHIICGQEQFMGMKMVKNVTNLYVPPEKTLDCYTAKCPLCLNSPLSYLIDFTLSRILRILEKNSFLSAKPITFQLLPSYCC